MKKHIPMRNVHHQACWQCGQFRWIQIAKFASVSVLSTEKNPLYLTIWHVYSIEKVQLQQPICYVFVNQDNACRLTRTGIIFVNCNLPDIQLIFLCCHVHNRQAALSGKEKNNVSQEFHSNFWVFHISSVQHNVLKGISFISIIFYTAKQSHIASDKSVNVLKWWNSLLFWNVRTAVQNFIATLIVIPLPV